jgi:ABC-type uncharacterized transport system YnjBCD substrate-binding protein
MKDAHDIRMNIVQARQRVLILLLVLLCLGTSCTGRPQASQEEPRQIVFYTWTDDHFIRYMGRLFEQEYGVHVRIVVTQADSYLRTAMQEQPEQTGTIDCLLVNDSYQRYQLERSGIIPAAADPLTVWYDLQDTSFQSGFIPLYRSSSGMLYDTEVVKDPPVSWQEFDRWLADHPGRFGFTAVGGDAGAGFIYSVYHAIRMAAEPFLPQEELPESRTLAAVGSWFRQHEEQMIYTSSDHDSIRLLLSGRLYMTPAYEHQVLQLLKQEQAGSSIAMYTPEFGAVTQVFGVAVPTNAPNGSDAAEFLRFLTTFAAQQIMEEQLFVTAVDHSTYPQGSVQVYSDLWERRDLQLVIPEELPYKAFIDAFKDRVLYY